jgi:VWFA-related protein
MRVSRFFLTALVLSAPLFPARSRKLPERQDQAIRISVDRVNVGVIVTDDRRHFVEGLHGDDFHIFDNGVEQPLTDFATIEAPAQVLLLMEAGPAVYLLQSSHLRAARALLDGLSSGDRVAVVKYAEAPEAIIDFTPDKQAVLGAFDELRFNLGFGALNLFSSLSKVLDWLTNVRGKKTIVLLSTGLDTSSSSEWGLTVEKLKISEVRVFAVSLSGELRDSPTDKKKKTPRENSASISQQFDEADRYLKLIAESTGGRAYFPANTKEFTAIYAEIAQLVRHEYSLAFAPPVHDAMLHTIEVHIGSFSTAMPNTPKPSYRVDHRRAYLAPPLSTEPKQEWRAPGRLGE